LSAKETLVNSLWIQHPYGNDNKSSYNNYISIVQGSLVQDIFNIFLVVSLPSLAILFLEGSFHTFAFRRQFSYFYDVLLHVMMFKEN